MSEREHVIDFTVPYYDLVGITIMMKKPKVTDQLFWGGVLLPILGQTQCKTLKTSLFGNLTVQLSDFQIVLSVRCPLPSSSSSQSWRSQSGAASWCDYIKRNTPQHLSDQHHHHLWDHHQSINYGVQAAYFVTSVLLWVFDRWSPYSYQNNMEKYEDDEEKRYFNFKESLWFCMTSLTPQVLFPNLGKSITLSLNQGGGEAPKNLSGRLVAATWYHSLDVHICFEVYQ